MATEDRMNIHEPLWHDDHDTTSGPPRRADRQRAGKRPRRTLRSGPLHKGDAAAPAALTVTVSVTSQTCINTDKASVTLQAGTNSKGNVMYQWDFNNDGKWDTAPSASNTVVRTMPEDKRRTVKVQAVDDLGASGIGSLKFTTIKCHK